MFQSSGLPYDIVVRFGQEQRSEPVLEMRPQIRIHLQRKFSITGGTGNAAELALSRE